MCTEKSASEAENLEIYPENLEIYPENLEIYREKSRRLREVAGASTKGRYDQRLPSVSFALGLNVCLID